MSPERWKQIEEVYYGVIASARAERSSLLDDLCLNNPDVRREVESLLEAREGAGNFLSPEHWRAKLNELCLEQSLVGQTMGPYCILSPIGAGAMGEVYLARDSRLDRQVALKILPPQFTRSPERIARFQREAKAASALNHPGIMAVYDIGQTGDTWFIAAEFIPGMTLRERLASGRIEWQEAVRIAVQCALALEAAHQAGIVHRDVKPDNIMLRPDGAVKVVDFGIARIAAEQSPTADATAPGTLMGTPRYMSPEQARGEQLDARADVFSLGAVLYEMVSGQQAFPGVTAAEVFAAVLSATVRRPSEFTHGVPGALDAVILKALERDRAARYPSMREFAADLVSAERKPGVAERVTGMRRVLAGLAAAFCLIALAWYFGTNQRSRAGEAPELSVVPLTSFEGYKDFGVLSPNGQRIAFSWNGGEGGSGGKLERNIYTKAVGADDPVRLSSSTLDDRWPAWSPDGQAIAFCRALSRVPDPSRFGIYIVPASGGEERKIGEGGSGVSWSPDGKTLAIAESADESGGIVVVSLRTGERRHVTRPRPNLDNLPVFSPDGRSIAFTRDFGFSAREIYVVPATGGIAKRLTFDREPTYGAAWTANGRELVFASNRGTGGESLWRIAARGGPARRLSPTLEGGFYPSISRDGKGLVYTQASKDTNVLAIEGTGFQGSKIPGPFGDPKGLILSSRRDDSPSISPRGDRIAFVSKRTGNEEIWLCDSNGSHLKELTFFKGPGTGTPRWSPNGQVIAFDSLAAGNPDIYLIDAAGGKPQRLTTGPFNNFMPSWSPDGNWLYFKTNRSGSDQIWRISRDGSSARQLTRGGATEAFASPDGKLVYFTKHAWGAIWCVPAEGGLEQSVPELAPYDKIFRSWGVIDQGIYFLSRQDAPRQTIRFFSFATRRVTALATLNKEPIWDYPDVALSRDGRLLLFAGIDQELNDLMLIENFR